MYVCMLENLYSNILEYNILEYIFIIISNIFKIIIFIHNL